jgi:hypothetical protein
MPCFAIQLLFYINVFFYVIYINNFLISFIIYIYIYIYTNSHTEFPEDPKMKEYHLLPSNFGVKNFIEKRNKFKMNKIKFDVSTL